MFKEFKEFIDKGNVLDLGVAVIMASSFGAVVTALVDNLLMPIIGALTAGIDFAELKLNILGVELGIGLFLNAVISFLIVAFTMFIIVKAYNSTKKKEEPKKVETKICPMCRESVHIEAKRCPHCTSEIE